MPTTQQLLDAVYSDPSSDTPRHVLADHLLEKGDERGEFIALQLARAQTGAPATKRELALLKKHEVRWIGPLDSFLSKAGRVFSRGFLSSARAEGLHWHQRFNQTTFRTVTGAREWATVQSFVCPHRWPSGSRVEDLASELLTHDCMRSLRAVHNAHSTLALQVASEVSLTELGLLGVDRDDEAALGRLRGITTLRVSEVVPEATRWLFGTRLWKHLNHFTVSGVRSSLGRFSTPLPKPAPPSLASLEFVSEAKVPDEPMGWHLRFHRDAGKRFRLHASFEPGSFTYDIAGDGLAEGLKLLEPTALTEIRVEPTRSYKPNAKQDALLRRACKRFSKVRRLELPEAKRS